MKRLLVSAAAIAVLLIWALQSMLFVVVPGQAALLMRQGRVERLVVTPGWHWKAPSPLVVLSRLELRSQLLRGSLSIAEPGAGARHRRVDWALQWQLRDPALALRRLGPGPAAMAQALTRSAAALLQTRLGAGVDAATLQSELRDALAAELTGSGIDVQALRITRLDVDAEQQQAMLTAMTASRVHAAQHQLRAAATALAAARDAAVREHAQAVQRLAQREQAVRAQTLARVIAVTAPVYRRNPAFARDYSALLTDRDALARQGAVIVLDADSPLLRLQPHGSATPAAASR